MNRTLLFAFASLFLLSSCATYITPGGQADLSTFTDPNVKKAFLAKPAIKFPANLAVVRIQESGYRSESCHGIGDGAYSVVTTRELETESDFLSISNLQGIDNVVTLNRLLLPKSLSSDLEVREAAAKLHADGILVYTIATEFRDNNVIPPLTTLSLGLAPNKHYQITSSASAILMDTKTGYIYGALEESDLRSGLTTAWGGRDAIEAGRRKAERAAFDKMLVSFGSFWGQIYRRYD